MLMGVLYFAYMFSIYPNNAPRDNTNVHPVACKPWAHPLDESRRIPPNWKKNEGMHTSIKHTISIATNQNVDISLLSTTFAHIHTKHFPSLIMGCGLILVFGKIYTFSLHGWLAGRISCGTSHILSPSMIVNTFPPSKVHTWSIPYIPFWEQPTNITFAK